MSMWISLLNDIAVSCFGGILSASFCNVLSTRRNRWIFGFSMVGLLLLQGISYLIWDVEILRRIYPVLVHVPLMLLLWGMTKKALWSVISVICAYLCCQLRRWISLFLVALILRDPIMHDVIELLLTVPLLLLLMHVVTPVMRKFINSPVKVQLHFGVIPFIYYAFDYVTMVYTDLLSSGAPVAVEFMPFVCCGAYLVFLLNHAAGEQKHNQLIQTQQVLDIQLKQSVREINALRESQAITCRYRHDMRHHLQYVSACIANGQNELAQNYISDICQEIESQMVRRYCENEAVNLIISSYDARARKAGITLDVRGVLSAVITISDIDLCVLLSNALENALHACQLLAESKINCVVHIQFYEREGKFFLQITNPCNENIRFEEGIPISDRPDHGFGVQSICAIVQRYGGMYSFRVCDGQFVLRLSI